MFREYILKVNPVAKPRMTRRDKWKHRPIVDTYYGFKDELKLNANVQGLKTLPASIESIYFFIPMPQSWSKKEKEKMRGTPHMQTPDLDNLLKALQDCLCKKDQHIWRIGTLQKLWADTGQIIINIELLD